MAEPEISVLLRTCSHTSIPSTPTTTLFGYALKCDNVSISYTKTPIQIPIPETSPQLIDIGVYRPSISLSGVIDTQGGNPDESTTGFEDMASFMYTRTTGSGGSGSAKKYFIPYKNKIEDFVTGYKYSEESPLELEWGDASVPIGNNHTGGAVYEVALQQCRLQVDATKEDRYTMSMQFVVTSRRDS